MSTEDKGHGAEPEQGAPDPLEGVPFPPERRDDEIARLREVHFPMALRGYDREEVDAYVRRVNRVVAELEVSRSPQSAVRHALEQVGDQTRGILQQAHEAAARITEEAQQDANRLLEAAEQEAREIRAGVEGRVAHLDAEVDSIWQERRRLLDDVRDLADELTRIADDANQEFPAAPAAADDTAIPEGAAEIEALPPFPAEGLAAEPEPRPLGDFPSKPAAAEEGTQETQPLEDSPESADPDTPADDATLPLDQTARDDREGPDRAE